MITKNQIKYIRGLSLKKNRIKEKCFIVEGEKCLAELLNSSFEVVELFALKDWIDENKSGFDKTQAISFKELERISNLKTPNKVLAVL
jgi:TrmH family RNA methyltransferase